MNWKLNTGQFSWGLMAGKEQRKLEVLPINSQEFSGQQVILSFWSICHISNYNSHWFCDLIWKKIQPLETVSQAHAMEFCRISFELRLVWSFCHVPGKLTNQLNVIHTLIKSILMEINKWGSVFNGDDDVVFSERVQLEWCIWVALCECLWSSCDATKWLSIISWEHKFISGIKNKCLNICNKLCAKKLSISIHTCCG